MNFSFSDTQKMIAETIRKFGEEKIRPVMMKYDESQEFPHEIFAELGRLGFLGVLVPEKYNGSGFQYEEYVTVIDEISQIDPSIGLSVAAHNSLCTGHILQHANEAQKQKYLPKLATGEWIGAWGLTEPNTGSDAGNMMTTAVKDGNEWVLNGVKTFITHGSVGDVVVIIARTGERGDNHGMSAFIIERGTPGFSVLKKEDKLGMRCSDTSQIGFQDCRIPEENLIGQVGEGFIQSLKVLDGGRISIGALGLGIAKGAYNHALKYSKERQQFNRPISEFQAIAFKLADMATEIAGAEALLYKAASMKDKGQKVTLHSAMAKYLTSEIAVRISTDAVQIFGGYGYIKDYPIEKFYRDSKLCTIGEGTSEIQKLVIARELLK